ncbi:MAG: small multi-drug export protein [Clostridia bacterium]|nr:small multi-drug export protein [Clostridia bacterium]
MKNLLWTFLISMVPVIELRGAIPAAAALSVPWYFAYPAAVVGNLIPVPFILFFIEKIFAWMKKVHLFPRLIRWLEEKAQKGAAKVEKYALFGLLLFVAIPLPGTGAWTGALIAALFHMDKKWSILSIGLGVLAAGALMTLVSYAAVGFLSFLL